MFAESLGAEIVAGGVLVCENRAPVLECHPNGRVPVIVKAAGGAGHLNHLPRRYVVSASKSSGVFTWKYGPSNSSVTTQ